jgi:hypothetical protein
MTPKLELPSIEFAQQSLGLIDLAVKAGGLNAAAVGLQLAQLIQAAIEAARKEQNEPHA